MIKDYYSILGISPEAGEGDIKEAYRKKVKEHHPDVNCSEKCEEQIRVINEAYQVLSDNTRRKKYDNECYIGTGKWRNPFFEYFNYRGKAAAQGGAYRAPVAEPLRQNSQNRSSRPDKSNSWYRKNVSAGVAGSTLRRRSRADHTDLVDHMVRTFMDNLHKNKQEYDIDVYLTQYEAESGSVFPFEIPVVEPCHQCAGGGITHSYFSCSTCKGDGYTESICKLRVRMPARVREGDVFLVDGNDFDIPNTLFHLHIHLDF